MGVSVGGTKGNEGELDPRYETRDSRFRVGLWGFGVTRLRGVGNGPDRSDIGVLIGRHLNVKGQQL